jgi:signal transduction histidine kinase
VVRQQRVNPEQGLDWLALDVATGGGRVTVNLAHEITGHPEWEGARIRVAGVLLRGSGWSRQTAHPMLHAQNAGDVAILSRAHPDPFRRPAVPLGSILRESAPDGGDERVRARGRVTLVRPNNSFYLQDETGGVHVLLKRDPSPIVGEAVAVVGFPESGAYSPVLRDADWRLEEGVPGVEPLAITPSEAPYHDARLVGMRGNVADRLRLPEGSALVVEESGTRFTVRGPEAGRELPEPGSRVEVTGVCGVHLGDWESFLTRRSPSGFSVWVRDWDNDIALLRAPPFWNATRLAWAGGAAGLLAALVFAGFWVRAQLRLAEESAGRRSARSLFQMVMAERTRMAREIHDTLAQGIAGISTQIELLDRRLATAPPNVRECLSTARKMAAECLADARRSVWNLRSPALEEHGLPGAVESLGRRIFPEVPPAFSFRLRGECRPLPAEVEENLLRIAQEALANVSRHADAKHVEVSLEYRSGSIALAIRDDGCGLPEGDPPEGAGSGSGFGLRGMRERVALLHGALSMERPKEGGLAIRAEIPVNLPP